MAYSDAPPGYDADEIADRKEALRFNRDIYLFAGIAIILVLGVIAASAYFLPTVVGS